MACNFTEHPVAFALPEEFEGGRLLIGNYGDEPSKDSLRPYEAYAVEK